MPAPSLRIPMSLNMAEFDKNVEKAKSSTATATRFITKQFVDMNAQLLATQGAAGAAALSFRSILGAVGPLSLAIAGIVGVFKVMATATELAKEKIEEFNEIAEKAGKANVSTDFFQRFTKSGEQLKLTVDDVNAALERFNNASRDALGGSTLSQRVAELQKAGNFSSNAGAATLSSATDTEARLRATAQLIKEALEAGQRLAALDIAKTAFGPEITDRLRQDASYLDQMLATADKLKADKIISDEQVGQAIQLKQRLEEAQKILAEKFKPIQDDLAKLGVQYHQSWIEVLETMASAVDKANQLYAAIKQIPAVMADLGSASFWTKLTDATEKLGLNSRPEGLIRRGEAGFEQPAGNAALAAGLSNPNAVRQAMQRAQDVATAVRGDTSKAPAKEVAETADAYDRAIESITKHTARLQADTQAVGLGVGAMEEFRAKAQLVTAAQQAGIPVQGETARRIDEIARAAGAAGEALARARVNSDIRFNAGAAFLSAEDVQIAQQLRAIYGNDIPAAMASSEAAAMRFNNALQQISQLGQDINRGFAVEFGQAIRSGASAMEALEKAGLSALGKIADKLAQMAADQLWTSAFGGSTGGIFSGLFGGGGGFSGASAGPITLGGAAGPVPFFAGGTDFAPGGPAIVGENGPEVVNLPRGAQVVPNDILRQRGGGDNFTYAPTYDARGADVAAVARLERLMAEDRAMFTSRVIATVQRARTHRNL